MTTFEFWRRTTTGEIVAVKLLDGIVVGACGPLHHDEVDAAFLPSLDYSEGGAAAIEASREAYTPLSVL